jgi:hypothetical protein
LLLAIPLQTGAQPACWPDVSLPISFQVAKAPTAPVKVGEIVYAASSVGLVFGWACIKANGEWYHVVSGGLWSDFRPDWLAIADAGLRGTTAERDALWAKYATATTYDPQLHPDVDAIKAALPRPVAAPAWVVLADPFRADKKRAVYSVVAGKRGAVTGQLVDAGAPCDPATTITEFGPTYFLSVLGNPATVARCVKK